LPLSNLLMYEVPLSVPSLHFQLIFIPGNAVGARWLSPCSLSVYLYLPFPNLKQFTHFHLSRIVDAAVNQNVAVDKKQVFQWNEKLNITRSSVRDAPCNHSSAGQLLGSRPKPQNPPLSKASRPSLAVSQPPNQLVSGAVFRGAGGGVEVTRTWAWLLIPTCCPSTPICALVEFPNTTLPLRFLDRRTNSDSLAAGLLHSLIAVGLGMRFEG
jgi:hypothetical protein